MEKQIALIQVWIGEIPDYFWSHYETTKNINFVDFFIFTDQELHVDAENYMVNNINIKKLEELVSVKFGSKIPIYNTKKVCDLKASYGHLFEEYIKDYDYFGCYDIDTLFGDFNVFVKPYLGEYDVISVGGKFYHNRISGPFLIMKNIPELYKIYYSEEFYNCMMSKELFSFEEHYLNKVINEKYKIKLINEINLEENNGGKNTYPVKWSGGKVFINKNEKFLYHMYRKTTTKLQKVGSMIYGIYDKKFIEDFYWVFGFSENYSSTIEFLMESIHKYSNRKCVIYSINFDYKIPDNLLISNQFILRRINIPEGKKDFMGRDENIINLKPKMMLDVLDFLPNKKYIFIDSDIHLTTSSDDIGEYFKKLTNYPLINSHTHDRIYLTNLVEGEEWTSTVDILAKKVNVEVCVFPRRKTNVMMFDEKSKWFFEEQISLYETYKDSEPGIFAFHDEDSANVILSKYKMFDSIHLCDIEEVSDIKMDKFTDVNHPFHMTGLSDYLVLPKNHNEVAFFHGLKNKERYDNIVSDYGNKVLDCEEILPSFIDNTIFFEKNSFLTSKIINENVDFIVKDLNGTIVEKLENQELFNYWVFYISNVFLDKKYYIIEIIKSNSKIKIYNNILCTTQHT